MGLLNFLFGESDAKKQQRIQEENKCIKQEQTFFDSHTAKAIINATVDLVTNLNGPVVKLMRTNINAEFYLKVKSSAIEIETYVLAEVYEKGLRKRVSKEFCKFADYGLNNLGRARMTGLGALISRQLCEVNWLETDGYGHDDSYSIRIKRKKGTSIPEILF